MYVTLTPVAWNLQRKVHLASVTENVQTKLLDEVSHQVSDHSMSVSQSLPKRAGGGWARGGGGGEGIQRTNHSRHNESALRSLSEAFKGHDDKVM